MTDKYKVIETPLKPSVKDDLTRQLNEHAKEFKPILVVSNAPAPGGEMVLLTILERH